jgi:ankyrin repeat protein
MFANFCYPPPTIEYKSHQQVILNEWTIMIKDTEADDRLWVAANDLDREDVVREIKKGDANINAEVWYGTFSWNTPLYAALVSGWVMRRGPEKVVEIADILIRNGADASQRICGGSTPLHAVVRRFPGSILLSSILEMCPNTDVNIEDGDGTTPLAWCMDDDIAWKKCNQLCTVGILILLGHGADPRKQNSSGNTILHSCQDESVISNVLAFRSTTGAFDINTRNRYGETPLFRGVRFHHSECPLLLANGADPRIPDDEGDTLLHLNINNEFMSKILNSPFLVDINALNGQGLTPLHMHVLHRNPDGVRLLLGAGAKDIDTKSIDFKKRTAEEMAIPKYPDPDSAMRRAFSDNHKKLAICMGNHPRLGAHSLMSQMCPELVEMIHQALRAKENNKTQSVIDTP